MAKMPISEKLTNNYSDLQQIADDLQMSGEDRKRLGDIANNIYAAAQILKAFERAQSSMESAFFQLETTR
jgi:hypothetical protein